jgi:SHS2 domain-containing protein
MKALVEVFVEVPERVREQVARTRLELSVESSSDRDLLVDLLEAEIYTVEVRGVVPVGFGLTDSRSAEVPGNTRISGYMDVVDPREVELVGPVPKGVSYYDLDICAQGEGWRCRAVVDV